MTTTLRIAKGVNRRLNGFDRDVERRRTVEVEPILKVQCAGCESAAYGAFAPLSTPAAAFCKRLRSHGG